MSITPETVSCIDVGAVLANGSVVVEASSMRPIEEGTVAYGFVLGRTPQGAWATWMYRLESQSTHSGNYFSSIDEARKDLSIRCETQKLVVL